MESSGEESGSDSNQVGVVSGEVESAGVEVSCIWSGVGVPGGGEADSFGRRRDPQRLLRPCPYRSLSPLGEAKADPRNFSGNGSPVTRSGQLSQELCYAA